MALTREQQRVLALARARQRRASAQSESQNTITQTRDAMIRQERMGAFGPNAVPERGFGEELANAIFTGGQRGVAGAVSLPRTLADTAVDVGQFISRKLVPLGDGEQQALLPLPSSVLGPTFQQTLSGVESVTGTFDAPESRPAKLAQTVSEFTTGAGLMGGIRGAAARSGIGATSGVASEAGGQMFEGTNAETPARVVGGVLGSLTPAAVRAVRPRPEAIVRESLTGVPDEQLRAASQLQSRSQMLGTPLTAAEALDNPRLLNAQRVVEQSSGGGQILNDFIRRRTEGIAPAVNRVLDDIGPRGLIPEQVANRVQDAAVSSIDTARRGRTASTREMFQTAGRGRIPRNVIGSLRTDIKRAMQDAPESAQKLLQKLDDRLASRPTVGSINTVRQELREAIDLPSINPNSVDSQTRGIVGEILGKTSSVLEENSPLLKKANRRFQQISRDTVEPLTRGDVGRLANNDLDIANVGSRVKAQVKVIIDPDSARPQTIKQVARELGKSDPDALRDVVRLHLENSFDLASKAIQSGDNTFKGAKFNVVLRGRPQQQQNLKAAIESLPQGNARYQGFQNLMNVLEAQGRRRPVGSPTAFNEQELRALSGGGGVLARGGSFVSSTGGALAQWLDDFRLGRNSQRMAELLTEPDSVDKLRQLARLDPKSRKAQALAITLLGLTANTRREEDAVE